VGGEAACWGEIDHPPRSLEKLEESMSRDELSNFHHAQRMNKRNGRSSSINGGDYYVQISSGMKHACAVTRGDGEIHCWGRNDYGESTPPSGKFDYVSDSSAFEL
jgi:alpha-tubulin suppressor-like RCC1 family protein